MMTSSSSIFEKKKKERNEKSFDGRDEAKERV